MCVLDCGSPNTHFARASEQTGAPNLRLTLSALRLQTSLHIFCLTWVRVLRRPGCCRLAPSGSAWAARWPSAPRSTAAWRPPHPSTALPTPPCARCVGGQQRRSIGFLLRCCSVWPLFVLRPRHWARSCSWGLRAQALPVSCRSWRHFFVLPLCVMCMGNARGSGVSCSLYLAFVFRP